MAKHNPSFQIPPGYTELLQNFTVEVLRNNPPDVIDFAVTYFTQLRDCQAPNEIQKLLTANSQTSEKGKGKQVSHHPVFAGVTGITSAATDDEEGEDYPMDKPPPPRMRRGSVAAERYNPEEDEDMDDDLPVVHAKTDEQRARLLQIIQKVLLFRGIDDEEIGEVIDAMFLKEVEPGDEVITQGDSGDNFYVIESGEYEVYINGQKVHEYNNEGSFGELALMYDSPRAATVTAKTVGTLWAMDRNTFRKNVVKKNFAKRKMFLKLLMEVPLLSELTDYEKGNIADALTNKTCAAGETIIKQGEEGNEMYFIQEGEVVVNIKDQQADTEKEIGRLSKGHYFGELALVTNQPRAASVIAETKCKVAVLDRDSFERLLGPCLDIMKRNIENYEKQVKDIFE
jgi:cAMP-dependent protein kinase regulator